MLQKDPNKRPDVHQLFKEAKVIEGMQYLSEVLDEETTKQLIEKNITVKSIFDKRFKDSKCANPEEINQMLLYLQDKEVYDTVLEYRGSEHGW
jgi:hypothetical protein